MSTPERHLLAEEHQPIDGDLWVVYDALVRGLPTTYELLDLPREKSDALKQEFFDSSRRLNPDLRAAHNVQDPLTDYEGRLLNLKSDVLSLQADPLIKQAYRWAINEAVANARMVHYSAVGDMRRLKAYNEFIYGQPDQTIFAATVDWFRSYAQSYLADDEPAVKLAAKVVLAQLPDQGGDKAILLPPAELFQKIKEQQFKEDGYFALAMAGVTLPYDKVTPEVGNPVIDTVLLNLGGLYKRAPGATTTWSADRYRCQLKHSERYNMPVNRFLGLAIGHEARHVIEAVNGMRQPLRLLGIGLDRNEKGSEGRAVIGEQVPYETIEEFATTLRWQDIMRRHLAISLAHGLAGQEMDFKSTFRVINGIDRLWERTKMPEDMDAADTKADKRSWDLLVRIMRGGRVYLKDKVYLEGNVACWKVAQEQPELIDYGDLGKFDITNPRHLALLQGLGILPIIE